MLDAKTEILPARNGGELAFERQMKKVGRPSDSDIVSKMSTRSVVPTVEDDLDAAEDDGRTLTLVDEAAGLIFNTLKEVYQSSHHTEQEKVSAMCALAKQLRSLAHLKLEHLRLKKKWE